MTQKDVNEVFVTDSRILRTKLGTRKDNGYTELEKEIKIKD